MHAFPDAGRLQFLVGLEVGQVCLDPWSIQFRFSDGGRITVEGEFHHIDVQGRTHIHQSGEERDTGAVYLRELVQARITGLEVTPFQLTLRFENGAALKVLTDEGQFECGQVYPPDKPGQPIVF